MTVKVSDFGGTTTYGVGEIGQTQNSGRTSGVPGSSLPDAQTLLKLMDGLPALAQPDGKFANMQFAELSALGSEAIMSMLGFEERKSAVDSGISSIETHRQERAAVNEERIKNLQEQAEKAEKSANMSGIQKVFSAIKMAFSALAAIGSIVLGAMSGNVLMVMGGVLLALATVDQIASEASDGKVSLAAGFAAAAKATGGNETAASIAGSVVSMLIGLTGALMSAGAGSQGLTNGVRQVANLAKSVSSVVSGLAEIGNGTVNIVKATYDSAITNLQAQALNLDAILMRIQQASDMDTNQLKKIMEKCEAMVEGTKEMLTDCNQTMNTVLGGAPAMA